MKKSIRIIAIALIFVLLLGTVGYGANGIIKNIQAYYVGVKLVVDGVPVVTKNANGESVEPFIYNGTTYLPIRSVGEALGEEVDWDGTTKTVYIGGVPGEETYLLDVCPPYQTARYSTPTTFKMSGKEWTNGFVLDTFDVDSGNKTYAIFNLDGKYNTLEFDVGHIDGEPMYDLCLDIYIDGEHYRTYTQSSQDLAKHISIPLNGALQLKIFAGNTSWSSSASYGFANVTVE